MTEEIIEPKKYQLTFDDDKNTLLHHAAAAGENDEVSKLIQSGHKIDPENYFGWTPLMMTARNGHFQVVKTMLDNRADATKQNRYGMSIFLISIASGNKEIVTCLLNHLLYGGVSKQSMEYYASPLSIALLFNCQSIFQYLLEQSFNVNVAEPFTGLTPIMFAAADEFGEYFNILVSKGANQQEKNSINQSAVDILHTKPNVLFPQPDQLEYQNNSPQIMITTASPQPEYYNIHPSHTSRKASNVASPHFVFPEHFSPIQGMTGMTFYTPQVFFPPQIAMSPPIFSPQTPIMHNSFLNMAIGPHSFGLQSPIPISPMPVSWIEGMHPLTPM